MPFSMRLQQKLDKLCRGYQTLRPRLTKYCRGRVPGVPCGVDAYGGRLKGGRYENVERGNANTALIHFTGGVTFSDAPANSTATAMYDGIHYALGNQHGLVSCITPV